MSGRVLRRASGHVKRVFRRQDPDPSVPVSTNVTVYWDGMNGQVVEGFGLGWFARLTSPVIGARTFIPVTLSGTVDPADITVRDYVEFAPGQTSVQFGPITSPTAAGGTSRTAIFTLDDTGVILEPEPGAPAGGYELTAGEPDVFTLTIVDSAPVITPTIGIGGSPGITGPESNITLLIAFVLSSAPSGEGDITAQVEVISSTGISGTNYIFPTQTVRWTEAGMAAGILTQRVPFRIIDDGQELDDIVTTLRVTYLSGNAATGPNNELAITVVESIQSGGPTKIHEVRWVTQSASIAPGGRRFLIAEVVDSGSKESFTFAQATRVPLTLTGDVSEWLIDWQLNVPNSLSFGPGEAARRIAIEGPDDTDGVNETITFTIEPPPT